MKQNRGQAVVWVLIVLVIVLAGGGVWYYKFNPAAGPQDAETASIPSGWKTYSNSNYGYSFSYPPDWQVFDSGLQDSIEFRDSSGYGHLAFNTISAQKIPSNSNISTDEAFIELASKQCEPWHFQGLQSQPELKNINGITALRLQAVSAPESVQVSATTTKDVVYSNTCYFFKNSAGDLMMARTINISPFSPVGDSSALDRVVSTLRLIQINRSPWISLLPQVRPLLTGNKLIPYSAYDPHIDEPIKVDAVGDINDDGVPEAIINVPWGGGAASWFVAIATIQDGKPALVKIKNKDGSISDAILLDAGSAGYAMGTTLDTSHKAIVYTSYGQNSDGSFNPVYSRGYATCGVDAYAWNPQTRVFEWNPALASKLKDQYCIKATPGDTS